MSHPAFSVGQPVRVDDHLNIWRILAIVEIDYILTVAFRYTLTNGRAVCSNIEEAALSPVRIESQTLRRIMRTA